MAVPHVYIDGVDVSGVPLTGSSTRRLNLPSQATVRLPMDAAIGDVGSRLKIYFDSTLHHHGRVLNCEVDTGEDFGTVVYNSTDPTELWLWRVCRDYGGDTPGNFIDPSFLERKKSGPQIIQEILLASENPAKVGDVYTGSDAEGPLFLSLGSFATGGVSLEGAPTNWPMTIAEMASLLVSTGELDIVISPTDSGGNMGSVSCHNGNYGVDRRSSLVFQYGMGARNVRRLRSNKDMSEMVNKLQTFAGPREGQRRFAYNITGSLFANAGGPNSRVPAGYMGAAWAKVHTLREASRAAYGVRMKVDIIDRQEAPFNVEDQKALDHRLWLLESWIRAQSRHMAHVEPIEDYAIGSFDIGDTCTVQASADVQGGFSGEQRIYEYTIGWDSPDGPLALSEIGTSPNNEGFA